MSTTQSQTVVITGASSGLGAEIAAVYARRRARIALFARRREHLDAVAERCRTLGTTDEGRVGQAVSELVSAWGRIDRAYLNAGGSGDRFKRKREEHFLQCCAGDDLTAANFSASSAEWIVRLNYLGVVYWMDP